MASTYSIDDVPAPQRHPRRGPRPRPHAADARFLILEAIAAVRALLLPRVQLGDDLREVDGRADASGRVAHDGHGVDGAVRGVARCRLPHPLERDRETQLDVEGRVTVDGDAPTGVAQVPRRIEIRRAVPVGAEHEQRLTVSYPVDDHALRGHGPL